MIEVPNLDYIKQIADGNVEFEKKFITIIQMEFPKEQQDYMGYIRAGELTNASKVVHKIKHKLGILGLTKSYQMALTYEEELKNGNTALHEDFATILKSVETFVAKIDQSEMSHNNS